jgi:hypothetical protein
VELEDQRAKLTKELENADTITDEAKRNARKEILEKQLEATEKAIEKSQDAIYSTTAEWAKAMKEEIETNMKKISKAFEDALTDGIGFEELMDSYDKLNTRQEEYLTKTNQIYETNKLMRTANKALDETDNKVAK